MSHSKPASPVVCLSRQIGAHGETVGRIVAGELGFRYVDEEIVERAAQRVDVPVDLVADVEARKSLLRRILPQIGADVATVSMMSGMTPPTDPTGSDDYRDLIQQAINEVAEEGGVVIVAHAASLALAGRPGLLRVLVISPTEARAHRLEEELGLTLEAARKMVERSDRDRADYFKRFYRTDELPTHYDLVVNTGSLSPEQAAKLVLAACATPAPENS